MRKKCWPTKKYVYKMSVAEMIMLRWMCINNRKDRIRTEYICEMVDIAPIEDKLRENKL